MNREPFECQDCGLIEIIGGDVLVDLFVNCEQEERFLCLGDLSNRRWGQMPFEPETWKRVAGDT